MLKRIIAGNPARGVVYIYVSMLVALVFGLASSSVTARLMTERDLGQYRFVISCITLLASALSLGLPSSAGMLLAGKGGRTFRSMVARGACTQAWIIAVVCSVCVGGVLLVSEWSASLSPWIAAAAVLGSAMAWPMLLQEILRASGNFLGLAVLNAAPTALFLLLLGASWLLSLPLDAPISATLYFLSQGLILWLLITSNGMSLKPDKRGLAYLFKINKTLGLNVYWGSFLAALTAQSGIFILQGVKSPADVAVFSLAVTVTAPLTLLPSAVGTAYFSRLPGTSGFPNKVIPAAWAVSFAITLGFCLLVPFVIHILYGQRFASVTTPAQLLGIGSVLNGMGDVYNRYYLANRDTNFLLKIAAIVCAAALIIGLPAGEFFGPIGVAVARLSSSCAYVFILVFYYHFCSRRFSSKKS
jgi:O-antigen/teichoic acid export membrane protein